MNFTQYEELCRLFVANEEKISIENIRSGEIPSAVRPGLAEYKNQIDLYWELEDKLTRNLVIVNAKWRSSDTNKVDQGDVLLIQQVKQEIDANKAMIITNTGFTNGARKAAENRRIALHIVCPNFDIAILDTDLKDRAVIQAQFQKLSTNDKPPYTYEIVHRAVDSGTDAETQSETPNEKVPRSKAIRQAPINRMAQPTSHQRAPSGTQKVQGGQGGSRTGGRGGTVQKGAGPVRGSGGRSNRGK